MSLQTEKEKRSPISDTQLLPSCLPPVRNPFKATSKVDKVSECRSLQCNGGLAKGGEEKTKAEGKEGCHKENVESIARAEEEELNSSDSYRGKQLPPGMKIKKIPSDQEETRPKPNGVDEIIHKQQGEIKDNQSEEGAEKKADPAVKDGVSKSAPSSSTQASKESDHTCDKPVQAESSHTNKLQDDEDDVVFVSVKPAAQKTPPVSAVQKTLTTFPGFQTASRVKVQQENIHSLLAAQLKQKKVCK